MLCISKRVKLNDNDNVIEIGHHICGVLFYFILYSKDKKKAVAILPC